MKELLHALDHVALHVQDVEASVAFYGDDLGFQPMPRPDFDFPGAWFRLGGSQELHLIGGRKEAVPSNNRGGHFAVSVTDFTAVVARLDKLGVIAKQPKPRPDGVMQVFIQDPDGHFIEFCEAVSSG